MVAINRRKKKRSSKNENVVLLAKLTFAAALIWTISAFLLSGQSGPDDTPPLSNKMKGTIESHHDGDKVELTGSDEGEVIGSVRGGSNVEQMEMDHTRKTDSVPKVKTNPDSSKVVPLRATNREIISTAPSVDIAFVDIANDNEEDPHRGATDEDGKFGYRHDETALRNNPPEFKITRAEAKCDNHDGNYKMLTQKVFVDIASHEAREREAEQDGGKPRAKIFCMAYTIEKNHGKLSAIRETWGQKCDGFMVASDKTDKELGTVNIPHEGAEEYKNIWQKVRSMWSYVYDNYYQDYDWFHIGGDDLYVIVENLRLYVESNEVQLAANGGETLPNGDESHQTPLFMGRRFAEQGNHERIFNSGGSGYTMNKAALKSLVVNAFPTCMPHLKTFAEDVMVAQCLRNKIRVFPFDTKDDEGGERYMPFQPAHHLTYKPPENKKDDWYANYSIDIKFGLDHCSSQSVAFHYIKPDLMRRMHAILYGHCA
jgi:glycoprotein-N-acetylgalactosamine 3-beta-galactosyltransferase